MQSLSKVDKIKHCTKIRLTREGAFQKSDLTSQIIAGPVILTITNAFSKSFFMNNHLLHESYVGFHQSGWIVLIKSEILIMTGMVWLVSSDRWKMPCVWSSSTVSDCDLISVT